MMYSLMIASFVGVFAMVNGVGPDECHENPLLYPSICCNATAPAVFNVTFSSTVGDFTIHVERKWSPQGVDRFYNLVNCHFFDSKYAIDNDAGFFRVVPGFVVQFGISGNPNISDIWENLIIPDDPVILSNTRGTIAYAAAMNDNNQAVNRTTQVYINYGNNSHLDAMGFSAFGVVLDTGMSVVDHIYAKYGQTPNQDTIYAEGDAYLRKHFPLLDYVTNTVLHV